MRTPSAQEQLTWISQWRSAAVALERVRINELAHADLARIAEDLDDLSVVAARERGRETSSGLIRQQALFRRAGQPVPLK